MPKASQKSALSKKSRVSHGSGHRGGRLVSKTLTRAQQAELRLETSARVERQLEGLSHESRQLLEDGYDPLQEGTSADLSNAALEDDDNDPAWKDVGPFEETTGDEGLLGAIRAAVQMQNWNRKPARDTRTYKDRLIARELNWKPHLESMARAYLSWKYPPPPPATPIPAESPHPSSSPSLQTSPSSSRSSSPLRPSRATSPTSLTCPASHEPHSIPASQSETSHEDTAMRSPSPETPPAPASAPLPQEPIIQQDFTLPVFDIYTLDATALIVRPSTAATAVAIVQCGYLSHVPLNPSILISLRTLELYRRLRLRKPSFSVEAFTKVICDLYMITYNPKYRTVVGDTFEVYMKILRIVDDMVAHALGRDTPNWRVLNACPPCTYKLKDEAPVRYARKLAMDGNDSLKRVDAVGKRGAVSDTRRFTSDYFVEPEEVDPWAAEVPSRKAAANRSSQAVLPENEIPPESDSDISAESDDDAEGPTSNAKLSSCTTNWKAAQSDAKKKKMWAIFRENGIFSIACRHGFMLWIADMIRSGEQGKYPLSMVNRCLSILGGKNILLGYDVGCSFSETVASTSLGASFKDGGNRLCVNAYHGYAHNFACQTKHHPNIIDGAGLEDLEVLERIFSSSNEVAGVTRFATSYRRRVFIDMYFRQWDEDKYLHLANFIYNNYIQALKIIKEESPLVDDVLAQLPGTTYATLDEWQEQQAEFFKTIGAEKQEDLHAIAYVELLQELTTVTESTRSTFNKFVTATPADYQYHGPNARLYEADLSKTRRLETLTRYTEAKKADLEVRILALEVQMNLTSRWHPDQPQYQETLKYIANRKYHRALNKLQKLVVQRLFELHRLNLTGVAYRARTHLAKSLQSRSKAIRRATEAYNTAAKNLSPPKPPLDWSEVSRFNFIEQFDLLNETNSNLDKQPWASSLHRITMKHHQRVKRAKEELVYCHVEARRLLTHITDEHQLFIQTLESLEHTPSIEAGAVKEYCTRRVAANRRLLATLYKLFALKEYSGEQTVGEREGFTVAAEQPLAEVQPPTSTTIPDQPVVDPGISSGGDTDEAFAKSTENISDDEEDDEGETDEQMQTGGLVDFIASLSLS